MVVLRSTIIIWLLLLSMSLSPLSLSYRCCRCDDIITFTVTNVVSLVIVISYYRCDNNFTLFVINDILNYDCYYYQCRCHCYCCHSLLPLWQHPYIITVTNVISIIISKRLLPLRQHLHHYCYLTVTSVVSLIISYHFTVTTTLLHYCCYQRHIQLYGCYYYQCHCHCYYCHFIGTVVATFYIIAATNVISFYHCQYYVTVTTTNYSINVILMLKRHIHCCYCHFILLLRQQLLS